MPLRAVIFDFFGVLYDPYSRQYNQPLITIIRAIKPQVKVGILSNTSGEQLRAHLQQAGITELFDAVVASGDTGYVKPQPEIFALIAGALGVAPGDALFFDDSPDHVAGAKAHGMQAVRYRMPGDVADALHERGLHYL